MKKLYLTGLLVLLSLVAMAQGGTDVYLSPFDFPMVFSGNYGEIRANHFHGGLDIKTQGTTGKPIRAQANGYKGIFGHRVVRGDGKSRAFVEKVVCFLLKCYFHVKVPDANAPFRLMNAKTVAKYLPKLDKDYNLPNIMMTTYFAYYKEEMTFKEVTFRPRQGGKNSINIRKIVKIGWKALKDFRKLKKAM